MTDLANRVLLAGEVAALKRGVVLDCAASMEELVEVNRANSDSWRPLLPIFLPSCHNFKPLETVCILGRDSPRGDVVLAQAARLYDWTGTSFHEAAESLALFYANPDYRRILAEDGQSITVTAPMARQITGRIAYTGAHWVRPDYRGKGLTGITPRMARALALAWWDVPLTCTIMAKDIFDKGVTERAGYPHHEWTVDLRNTPTGTFPAALLWATREEIIEDLERWLEEGA